MTEELFDGYSIMEFYMMLYMRICYGNPDGDMLPDHLHSNASV